MTMHHGYCLSSSQSTTKISQIIIFSQKHYLYPLHFNHQISQFASPTSLPIVRSCYGTKSLELLVLASSPFLSNSRNLRKRQRCRIGAHVRASVTETPYDVLGVSPSATVDDIKRAYRKLALKYHPDVNREANAQEKFMRIKHAYNTLLSSDSRTRYNSGNRNSDFSYSTAGGSWSTKEEEEFYGFGDFFRDLQEEFRNWEANASSQGKPMSLWEELAEIGEEFVEFLEKELNIKDEDLNIKGPRKDLFEGSNEERGENRGEGNSIKESIDEIEEALSQLKKELGL